MKRPLYKYVFIFNIVALLTVAITVSVFLFHNAGDGTAAGVSITTPLVCAAPLEAEFCSNASAAVIIDAASGAVLFGKNVEKRLPMASTTKIMTALAVIENADVGDVVTVSKNAAMTEGSSIYLTEGEKITVKDLLYGLMLESGNDAATALAEGVFGSVEAMCEYMNNRAERMGLVNTSFANAHGLDSENHYTTAYELALITKEAMKNPFFREIVSTKSYISTGEKTRYFSNHNRLLKSYPTAVGVKTGYTSRAGRCLVSATKQNGSEYIAVTLNDSLDWQDHKDMHDYAASNFINYEIAGMENFVIYSGFSKYAPSEEVYVTTTRDSAFVVNYKITCGDGEVTAHYSTDSMSLGRFPLVKLLPSANGADTGVIG